jgi:plastocyanin
MKTLLLATLCCAFAASADAGSVQITVTDKDGKPAPDVVVLIDAAAKTVPAPAATPVVIAQEGLKFVPFLSVVPVGSTLRFTNKDNYDHHVRSTPSGPLGSMPPAAVFEMRLDAAEAARMNSYDDGRPPPPPKTPRSGTTTFDVKVTQAGPIGLGCHLHSSMRGQVYVSGTPWFAKTDANGVARIDNVPDGAAELTLWHSDQVQEQPVQRLQVGSAPLQATGQLNFAPRRRRS